SRAAALTPAAATIARPSGAVRYMSRSYAIAPPTGDDPSRAPRGIAADVEDARQIEEGPRAVLTERDDA
ncbi:MAG: hypothetical protein KC464_22765, partial [Myxococcales bacterium]|nr:hypothetical protein [Myxococcales bacterium]